LKLALWKVAFLVWLLLAKMMRIVMIEILRRVSLFNRAIGSRACCLRMRIVLCHIS
jgi:hypothetical protein